MIYPLVCNAHLSSLQTKTGYEDQYFTSLQLHFQVVTSTPNPSPADTTTDQHETVSPHTHIYIYTYVCLHTLVTYVCLHTLVNSQMRPDIDYFSHHMCLCFAVTREGVHEV